MENSLEIGSNVINSDKNDDNAEKHDVLRIVPTQMKDKAKETQDKYAERVERSRKKTSCALFPKNHNTEKFYAKEARVNRVIKRQYLHYGAFIYPCN